LTNNFKFNVIHHFSILTDGDKTNGKDLLKIVHSQLDVGTEKMGGGLIVGKNSSPLLASLSKFSLPLSLEIENVDPGLE
jgi:hypothetical protein